MHSFPKPVRPQGTTSVVKDYFTDLHVELNSFICVFVRLDRSKITKLFKTHSPQCFENEQGDPHFMPFWQGKVDLYLSS